MEIWKKEKKILTAFGVFLSLMFLCTLISRAVYASKLPQVTVDTPKRMGLSHRVEADGIVRQGQEYAVNVLSGLRVRTVWSRVGDRVTPETLLFELDTEDLKDQIHKQEIAVRKMELQIQAQEQNENLENEKRQTDITRAREDYERAQSKAAEAVDRAEEDLSHAEDELEQLRNHPVETTSEEERQKQQQAYEDWVRQEAELKEAVERTKLAWESARAETERLEAAEAAGDGEPDAGTVPDTEAGPEEEKTPEESGRAEAAGDSGQLTAARQAEAEAKKAYEEAQSAYQSHADHPVQQPDYSAEDAAREAWEEQKESLKDAVESAKRTVEDAEQSQSDTLLDAGRKVDDSNTQANADNSLEINRLELAALQETLADYKKILEADGKIYPETEGIVTRIQVSSGERTPDGAAVVYADMSSPLQFCVSLTKEQKQYVNQGDLANLTLGNGSSSEVTVDYVAENEINPELYDVHVVLPENVGTIGESGRLKAETQSEMFSCCIPIEALHEDSNKQKYVYTVSERAGILGKELAAELIYVKVLDQNDKYAAIEEGVISQDMELIVSATEELQDRAVVRYKE